MKKFYTLLSLLALIGLANTPTMLYAQTSLIKGDIAFLELQGDTPDGFIFILLVDVETGTRINFSDIGYRNSDGYAGTNEGAVVIWTATSNLSAGTVVKLTIDTPISATQGSFIETTITNAPGTSSLAIAGSGDQLVAWQDAGATAALPTSSNVIAAVNGASSDWGTLTNSNGSLDSNTSDLYGGLTDGVNAVTAGAGTGPQDEHDNIRFDPALFCSLNNKTKGQILVIVNDQDN